MWKLTDFGFTSVATSAVITSLYGRGTPGYRAPELLLNWEHRHYSTRSDIWSLGCIIHEMATGRRAFENDFDTDRVYRTAQIELSSVYSSYDGNFWRDQLCECICDLLSKNPDDRPSATVVSKKLAAYDTVLELPGIELPPDIRPSIRWNSLSDGLSLDTLYDLVKECLPKGTIRDTSFPKIIAQSLTQKEWPWVLPSQGSENFRTSTEVERFWVKNYSFLRQVGEALIENRAYEDADLVYDWLLHHVPHSVYPTLEEAAESGDKFSAVTLLHCHNESMSILWGNWNLVEMLVVKCGVDPNVLVDRSRWTALLSAVAWGEEKLVQILLQHKASMDMDEDGRTPLHWAALLGREKVVEILLQYKANVDMQDDEGKTPFDREKVVKILLQHEANMDMQDKERKTPFTIK